MSRLVEAVRRQVPPKSLARKCEKKGCRVSLKNVLERHLLVDFDKLDKPSGSETKCCDYLFVSDRDSEKQPYVALIELKRGRLDVSDIVAQIKAGADIAKVFFSKKTVFSFRPVAACGGKATKIEIKRLREERNKISFHGHRESIRLIRSGSPLIKALRT